MRSLRFPFMAESHHIGLKATTFAPNLAVNGSGKLTDVFEAALFKEFENFPIPLVVLEEWILSSFASMKSVNIRLERDMAVMATAFRPWA